MTLGQTILCQIGCILLFFIIFCISVIRILVKVMHIDTSLMKKYVSYGKCKSKTSGAAKNPTLLSKRLH